MLHAIKMSIARIWWQDLKKKKRIAVICLIIGFSLVVIGLAPYPKSIYWLFVIAGGLILLTLFYVLSLSITCWINELPEYKEREANRLLNEAREFIGEVCEERSKETLLTLITRYGLDKTNLQEETVLRDWIDCYKDIIFLRECVVGLEKKEVSIPNEINKTETRIDELIAKLDLETQNTEQALQ